MTDGDGAGRSQPGGSLGVLVYGRLYRRAARSLSGREAAVTELRF